jgi:hypothetical protein
MFCRSQECYLVIMWYMCVLPVMYRSDMFWRVLSLCCFLQGIPVPQ